MKILRNIVCFICAVLASFVITMSVSEICNAEQWAPVVKSDDGKITFFIERDIVVEDGLVKFAVRSDHPTVPHIGYWAVNCSTGDASITLLQLLGKDNKVERTIYGPMKVEHSKGEVADNLISFICKKTTTPSKIKKDV